MPTNQRFPIRPFAEEFARARESIAEYFDFAYEIWARVRRQLDAQDRRKRGSNSTGRHKNARGVVAQAANEFGFKYAYANQAKKCGREFDPNWVEWFLERCEAVEYLPSREVFVALSRVKPFDREWFVYAIFENEWSASDIKKRCKLEYGCSSNGGKKPQAPKTLQEAADYLRREEVRLTVLYDTFVRRQPRASGVTGYQVPETAVDKLKKVRKLLEDTRKILVA